MKTGESMVLRLGQNVHGTHTHTHKCCLSSDDKYKTDNRVQHTHSFVSLSNLTVQFCRYYN